MTIIEHGQQNWLLTRWTDCWDLKSESRYWLNQNTRAPAAIVIEKKGLWSSVIFLPDGEVLDVITTTSKKTTQGMSSQILKDFVDMCSTTIKQAREPFRNWLDI